MSDIPKTKAAFERLASFSAAIPGGALVEQEMLERSMLQAQQQAKEFNARQPLPVTLVEHMTDPRAAQLQMLFASLDERGKKTLVAMAAAMVKLHKDQNHG